MRVVRVWRASAIVAFAVLLTAFPARAEVTTLRVSYGYGILYLPLMVMDREQLIERRAKAAASPLRESPADLRGRHRHPQTAGLGRRHRRPGFPQRMSYSSIS